MKSTFHVTADLSTEKIYSTTAKVFPQYAGATVACIAAFAIGNILGWTSPASPILMSGGLGFPVTVEQNSWVGGLMPIGAALSCVPAGYFVDRFGRKATLLGLVPIFILGWILIICANSVAMLYVGRFISGLTCGSVSLTSPTFAAEICQKEIRGSIGTLYQLMIAAGITFVYIVGSVMSIFWFSIICAMFPILFALCILIFPDTPIYFLSRGDPESARKSLQFYRGSNFDVEPELAELAEACNKIRTNCDENDNERRDDSLLAAYTSKQAFKSVSMSIGMMIVQQLSGVNAIIFYTTSIFEDAGSSLKPEYSTVLIGAMEVFSTFLVAFIIDRLGRRILLTFSAAIQAVCTLTIGVYFFLKIHHHDVDNLGWLPLTSLCVYIIVFSIGYGPVPWAVMPEILPSRIKGTAGSIACVVNWICCFIVTKFFSNFLEMFGSAVTFWIFTCILIVGTYFSWFGVVETKGKTFEEIQLELAGDNRLHRPSDYSNAPTTSA